MKTLLLVLMVLLTVFMTSCAKKSNTDVSAENSGMFQSDESGVANSFPKTEESASEKNDISGGHIISSSVSVSEKTGDSAKNSSASASSNNNQSRGSSSGSTSSETSTENKPQQSSSPESSSQPAQKSIYDRPYDVSAIEKDMEKYTTSKGGKYEWGLNLNNFGYWNDSLVTSPNWQGNKLRNTLIEDIDQRMSHGIYDEFRVFFEPKPNGEHEIYVLCS